MSSRGNPLDAMAASRWAIQSEILVARRHISIARKVDFPKELLL